MNDELDLRPAAELRFDTFGLAESVGLWCVAPAAPPAGGEASPNAHLAAATAASFDALGDIVVPWGVDVLPEPDTDVDPLRLERAADDAPAAFVARVRQVIETFPAAVRAVEADVDVIAYVRTADSPDRPVRARARLGDVLYTFGGEKPAVCLSVQHTLFAPYSPYGLDNAELHALNQPLLEAALRRWEERVGPIIEFEGYPGIFRYGFRTPTESSP
ncbi:MAG TPA: hypothetical protein VF158_05275 [Longimicrobiales bacterium]